MNKSNQRRAFIKKLLSMGGGAAILGTPLISNLAMASTIRTNDYKALVCIDLKGGNDASNMIIPNSTKSYDQYALARPDLAIPQESLNSIFLNNSSEDTYGLHPELVGLQQLFNQGHAAIVANVGPRITQTGCIGRPPKSASHTDQSRFWHGVDPEDALKSIGWLGRANDEDVLLNQTAFSFNGGNALQTGSQASSVPYIMNSEGASTFWNHIDTDMMNVFDDLNDLAKSETPIFPQELARLRGNSKTRGSSIQAGLTSSEVNTLINNLNQPFPNSKLGDSLEMVIRTILANQYSPNWQTGRLSRQSFYTIQGGYDTHNNQIAEHNKLYKELDAALSAFQNALSDLKLHDKVTTFTVSEFGRTYTGNGSGSDHGWGGHQLILGEAVNGNSIYGNMPDLSNESNDFIGERKSLVPSIAIEESAATLARWFGISNSDLPLILPHLNKFKYRNLGFMQGITEELNSEQSFEC